MDQQIRDLAPGLPYTIPIRDWTQGEYLVCDINYQSVHTAKLNVRFFTNGDAEPAINICYGFLPGLTARLCFGLRFLDGQRLFMPRYPGQLKGTCLGRRIDRRDVSRAELLLEVTPFDQQCRIGTPYLSSEPPQFPCESAPLVDQFGQYTGRNWPGKTRSEAELVGELRSEHRNPDHGWPSDWSRFGGYARKAFRPTGFFRTEHDGERWWLVDPDGCGFFSSGLDCVRDSGEDAVVTGTEHLYSWLPLSGSGFDDCEILLNRRQQHSVMYGRANLRRAFGDPWKQHWSTMTTARLHRWRFNTIACWSDLEYASAARIPFVTILDHYPTTQRTLFRDLPDVFDPAFETASRAYARTLSSFADNPYLIGYFMTNEPKWGFGQFNLAAEILETEPGSFTRKELASFVARRYDGDAAAWRSRWGIEANGFDQLVTGVFHRLGASGAASDDLMDFSREIVRRFVGIPSEALRREDPNHLNLGMRFAWIASDLFYEAGKFVDVFSINCYQMLPDSASAGQIATRCGKPTMIGEFHFGALDRGLLGTGLRGVANQIERGVAYRRYVEACAADPNIVGCHYFTLSDEPVLGRFDGENWQIGFVDVCGKPYPEIGAAAALTHERMYLVRDRTIEPYGQVAEEIPRIGH